MNLEQVLSLSPANIDFNSLSQEEILHWFEVLDAGWVYNGEPSPDKPHAELASGLCSDGYFNCRKVMCHPRLAEILAIALANKLKGLLTPDVVIGSPYSAITFSYEVARALGVPHFFTEKDPIDPKGKKMVFKEEIPSCSLILRIEELITTTGTTQEVERAVFAKDLEVEFSSSVGTCIHRPDKIPADTADCEIVSLVETLVRTWKPGPKTCPFCKVGSPRVKPKANWAKLVGKV